MPRKVEIITPSHQTDELITDIQDLQGIIGLRVQRQVSIHPPGDVIVLETTNRSINRLMRLLEQHHIGCDPTSSITTSEPFSLISAPDSQAIAQDTNDVPWEEMKALIQSETTMNANVISLMAIAGAIAAIGIATNALHLVIGAMVIAPGFQPIVQIALGSVAQNPDWRSGVVNTAKGYIALIIAAALTGLVLNGLGISPLSGKPSYLPTGSLITYWTNITATSLLVTTLAGLGGAILIASHRSVLTSGVMIALALIPSATIVSLGLVTGRLDIAGKGLLRWGIEAGLVILSAVFVFIWKRDRVQKRKML